MSIESPVGFFTNVAARLLKSELNLDLNQIQVYPTNQYLPPVHRLLQVTANLYDCMTNRTLEVAPEGFPSVFQPILVKTPTNVVIGGYREIVNPQDLLNRPTLDLYDTNAIDSLPLGVVDAVAYGIPAIIGARKGFPNFNEFSMQAAVTVFRKLEFWKDMAKPPACLPDHTNQMIMVGISNTFGAELWNSYTNAYGRPLQIVFAADISAYLTNQFGQVVGIGPERYTVPYSVTNVYNLGTWPGCVATTNSFVLPLNTTWCHLPASAWRAFLTPEQFEATGTQVFDAQGFAIPHWWLNVRARVRCALLDTAVNRIVDYVNLDAREAPVDVLSSLMRGAVCEPGMDGNPGSMWCTNQPAGGGPWGPNSGVLNQIAACRGLVLVDWGQVHNSEYQVDYFRYNFNGEGALSGTTTMARTNRFFAPYTPTRTIYLNTSWQANDPLVHYTAWDMNGALSPTQRVTVDTPVHLGVGANLRQVNTRYEPWGGNPNGYPAGSLKTALQLKDPLISRSDDWNFPVSASEDLTWLGRVHRGTPWQSLYLKSAPININDWSKWMGYLDPNNSRLTQPVTDWHLAGALISMLDTNPATSLLSANQPDVWGWTEVLRGISALTNTLSEADWESNPFQTPQFEVRAMEAESPQTLAIAAALDNFRLQQSGRLFQQPADILAVPQLSVASPWLNTSGSLAVQRGMSEAAYEAIPSQLLPRLRPDSLGSVVQADDTFRIQFSGQDDYAYAVEVSANLTDWVAVSTNIPVGGSFIYSETRQQSSPSRFYRSVVLP